MGGARQPRTERNAAVSRSTMSGGGSGTETTVPNNGPSEATTSNSRSAAGEAAPDGASEDADVHIGDWSGAAQPAAGTIAVTTNTAIQTSTRSRRFLITLKPGLYTESTATDRTR
jgi:hypothetical protein